MSLRGNPPWMTAWQDAQREFSRLTTMAAAPANPATAEVQQRLADYARDYAGVAAAAFAQWQPGGQPFHFDALREPLTELYRQLFMPKGLASAFSDPSNAGAGPLLRRAQLAGERYAGIAAAIAADAGRRLGAALAASGPSSPPVTSLRELHALWIECGEAAWAAAAHGEEFSAAQAELLGALVELRALTPR